MASPPLAVGRTSPAVFHHDERTARFDRCDSAGHHRPVAPALSRGMVSAMATEKEILTHQRSRGDGLEPAEGLLPGDGPHQARPRQVLPWRSPTGRCAAPAAGRWRSSGSSMARPASRSSRSGRPENVPEFIRTATLTFPSGRTADEIVIDDAAGLAWVVNLGCIDLNPHPVRAEDLDHPDELRVDLDPVPGVRVAADPRGGARRARVARGGRAGRLAQDVGLARDPHQRPDRAALDVPGGPPGGARAGPRRRAPRARPRHLEVVEGGAPRRLPRLQPERQGPDGRLAPTPSGRCPTRASRRR